MVYLVLSGALPSMYQRQEAALPKTNIQIINFINNTNAGDSWNVTIRNNGPVSLQVGGRDKWQVFIDDRPALIPLEQGIIAKEATGDRDVTNDPNYSVPVNGVIVIKVTISLSTTSPHTVKVFGPQATQAFAGWSPKS
ncbi:hypothetical protein D6D85_14545 [Candidatus Methanodesulfokora washburnensis]|uniref:Uncharacterized protein n=2 Tax=Candidatus Methanodesulfokora washburnensis TaxID=2478471 RepID=A0A3R9PEI3_9CREN|nr:hypothetical protein D6D85_14545 [Candidatus Methanodesulfokores washburnensis]